MRRALVMMVMLASSAPSAVAAGETPQAADRKQSSTCGRAGRPWVSVAFSGQAWTAGLQRAVLEDLRAGLRLKGIDACALGSAGSEPPLALIELAADQKARVSVGIDVHDAVTEKRVIRDLDLGELAADARALAIAAAADELLRASWAELALQDAPQPAREPPAAVEAALRDSIAPARVGRRDHGVGARAAIEHHGGGHTQFGGDAFVAVWFAPRWAFELGVGLREGLTRDAEHGRVESRALVGRADAVLALLPRGRVIGLEAKLGIAVSSVRMRGDAAASAREDEGAGLGAHARLGLGVKLLPWPALALAFEAGAGAPVRSVEAVEDGRVVSSTGGLALHAGVGTELRF